MHPLCPQKHAAPGRSSSLGHGSGLCPHSPAIALGPSSTRPSTTIPAPTPVPRIAPKTTLASRPAPSVASDSAKQFASLVMRISRSSKRSRSRLIGWPLRHTEFEPRSSPVAREIEPGVPSPTVPVTPSFRSASRDQARQRIERRAIVVARRDNAPAQEFPAVGRKRDDLGLRPAQVDAEPHGWLQSVPFVKRGAPLRRRFVASSNITASLIPRSQGGATCSHFDPSSSSSPQPASVVCPRRLTANSISFARFRRIGASSSPTSSERKPASRSRWCPRAVARRSRRSPSRRASRRATSGSADRPKRTCGPAKFGLVDEYASPMVAQLQPWAQKVAEQSKSTSFGAYARVLGIGYNSALATQKKLAPPACWKDLIKPGYAGRGPHRGSDADQGPPTSRSPRWRSSSAKTRRSSI